MRALLILAFVVVAAVSVKRAPHGAGGQTPRLIPARAMVGEGGFELIRAGPFRRLCATNGRLPTGLNGPWRHPSRPRRRRREEKLVRAAETEEQSAKLVALQCARNEIDLTLKYNQEIEPRSAPSLYLTEF